MPERKLLSDIKVFGSAIKQTGSDQRHAGIVFKNRDTGKLFLLHLAWHLQLILEELPGDYSLVPMTSFDDEELQLFAESAAKVFEENSSAIPYGLSYTGAAVFNGDLKFIDSPGGGLTCSTFLLGFFEALGFDVLDLETWENRTDDTIWQELIYGHLAKRLSKEQAAQQRQVIGTAFRFRPEEVVGAVGVYDDDPLAFAEVTALGEQVIREMKEAKTAPAAAPVT